MKMKKWIAVSGLVISLSALSACSNSSESDAGENTLEKGEKTEAAAGREEPKAPDDLMPDLKDDLLNPPSESALVNKQYSLPNDYAPDDLVRVEVPTVLENPEINQLREEAALALKKMFSSAEQAGVSLSARSGYRSYKTQVQLFESYAANYGEEAANLYSARPGESEHQTGLAMDITSSSVNYQLSESFGETPEGIWVSENAHKYGFIIRYPQDKKTFTGYLYEPWHIRYLGEKLASDVYESGLTYEEYLIDGGIDIEIQE